MSSVSYTHLIQKSSFAAWVFLLHQFDDSSLGSIAAADAGADDAGAVSYTHLEAAAERAGALSDRRLLARRQLPDRMPAVSAG